MLKFYIIEFIKEMYINLGVMYIKNEVGSYY